MPSYSYFCEANQQLVIVRHDMGLVLKNWAEVCYARQIPLGETDPLAPVKKVISPPNIIHSTSNAELRNLGFTKLIKRDEGIYENVTALDHEARYMKSGDASSIPDIKKKIGD